MLGFLSKTYIVSLLNDKKRSKHLVLGPGAQEPFGYRIVHNRYILTSCPGHTFYKLFKLQTITFHYFLKFKLADMKIFFYISSKKN